VSGGSIAGAAWVYWQVKRGDTLRDSSAWDEFERTLITLISAGAREHLMWRALWRPFAMLSLGLCVAVVAAWPGVRELSPWGRALVVPFGPALAAAIAYLWWHYRAARLYESVLDEFVFHGATLGDPYQSESSKHSHRFLAVNATGLNSGDHLLFTRGANIPVGWSHLD